MVFRTVICALLFLPFADAYSVLTHEALIDTAWDPAIKPILQARYPKQHQRNCRRRTRTLTAEQSFRTLGITRLEANSSATSSTTFVPAIS